MHEEKAEISVDLLISNAARALAAGDPLAALNQIALRDDAPALALRGIAMAQLGDFARATVLLRAAASGFGAQQPAARARCVVAEADVALAARNLTWPDKALTQARAVLQTHGDWVNAAHAASLSARRQLLTGQLDAAERTLAGVSHAGLPAATRALLYLIQGCIALRRIQAEAAQAALTQAAACAQQAGIAALMAEVEQARSALTTPAARLIVGGQERALRLHEVEALLGSSALIVDACRHWLRCGMDTVTLASRPVLFALVSQLALAWPGDVTREALIARVFRTGFQDETHRARLRVEIGRLRAAIAPLADVAATASGYVLKPAGLRSAELTSTESTPARSGEAASSTGPDAAPLDFTVCVLARPVAAADRDQAAILACLADGQPWSSSALALALGASQRTVQRALDALAAAGQAQPLGKGRSRRWTTPPVPAFSAFTTSLLLPGLLSDP